MSCAGRALANLADDAKLVGLTWQNYGKSSLLINQIRHRHRKLLMLEIYTIPVTPFSQNARVLYETESGSVVVVDPGGDVDLIWAQVSQSKPTDLKVLLTHAHIDHAGGTREFMRLVKASSNKDILLVAHPDPILRSTIQRQAKLFGLPIDQYQDAPQPDIELNQGDRFAIGNTSAQVDWVPGHAPDHITLYFDVAEFRLHEAGEDQDQTGPVLLAGDTLFAGSIGRTDLPGGSMPVLLKNIQEKLLVLPDETVVLCGHGPSTTIGQEKQFNPFLN